MVSSEEACPAVTVGCLHAITCSSSHLPESLFCCSDAHQHYLWGTWEDKYNNIFLKEYNSDEIRKMLE